MRVLLTGATGYLGRCLLDALRARAADVVTAGRGAGAELPLELDDLAALPSLVAAARAEVVLHAAATSSVQACAADPAAALRRNGDAVAALARGGAWLVLVSTDLVFGGDRAPYRSGDAPDPRNAYARSKALGEQHAREAGGLVVRLPLLLGPSFDGRRGATDMLRARASAGPALRLFSNEFRTPLHVADAAAALAGLALGPRRSGTLHAAGPERVSRLELARRFLALHPLPGLRIEPAICEDPERPRDVSLVSDLPFRPLDAMLAEA